jgi:hypothetical protein
MQNINQFNEQITEAVWAILNAKRIAYQYDLPWSLQNIVNEVVQQVNDISVEASNMLKQNNT